MSQVVAIELEIPDDLARFRLPPAVEARLQALLDRQGDDLPPASPALGSPFPVARCHSCRTNTHRSGHGRGARDEPSLGPRHPSGRGGTWAPPAAPLRRIELDNLTTRPDMPAELSLD